MHIGKLVFSQVIDSLPMYAFRQGVVLYHRGIRGNVSRSTVADANERRDWRI